MKFLSTLSIFFALTTIITASNFILTIPVVSLDKYINSLKYSVLTADNNIADLTLDNGSDANSSTILNYSSFEPNNTQPKISQNSEDFDVYNQMIRDYHYNETEYNNLIVKA